MNILNNIFLINYLLFLFFINDTFLYSQTTVKGVVSGTWNKQNSPYLISGDIAIENGSSLFIEKGTQVIFRGHFRFLVDGLISASGTKEEPVIFTAQNSDSGWGGIRFENAHPNCKINYCWFEYGKAYNYRDEPDIRTNIRTLPGELYKMDLNESGGIIRCIKSKLQIDNCLFQNNEAVHAGGALFICENSEVYIFNSTFRNNKALNRGGGSIAVWHSYIHIQQSKFTGSIASKFVGGAIDIEYFSECFINNCQISNNMAYAGGGINLLYSCRIDICNSNFSENYSKIGGGLNFNEKCKGNVQNSIFEKNYGVYGGGITISEECNPGIDSCRFRHNRAKKMGGGIFIAEVSNPSISNSVLIENISEEDGGGIYCQDSHLKLLNSQIARNSAHHAGGGIYYDFARTVLGNNRIHNNEALRGGGIYFENCSDILFSDKDKCSIYMNRAREIGNDLFAFVGPDIEAVLDTFTVKQSTDLHTYPNDKFRLMISNYKLTQVSSNIYVSPEGSDRNTGITGGEPLRTLNMALSKLQHDSLSQRTIYLSDGEYESRILTSDFSSELLRWVKISPEWGAQMNFLPGKIRVYTPWWNTYWAYLIYVTLLSSIIIGGYKLRTRQMRQKHEAEIEHLRAERLEEIDRVKTRFFANISHEFRTPITLILAPVTQMITGEFKGSIMEGFGMIRSNARKLLALVNQMLALSKLDAGQLKLQVCKGDIVIFVDHIFNTFLSLAEHRDIDFRLKNDLGSLEMYFDPEKLETILNNLLSNAFKYTPSGGRIEVGLTPLSPPLIKGGRTKAGGVALPYKGGDTGGVTISVTNTGPGIPPEEQPHIFDRFYQGRSAAQAGGTGIGLALVRDLAELHHGHIHMESIPGRETVFTIAIPADDRSYEKDEVVEADRALDTVVYPLSSEAYYKKLSHTEVPDVKDIPLVLIVEDSQEMRGFLSRNLSGEYRIIEADNGRSGFSSALDTLPDLIISDVMMPEMNGFELCSKIKNDRRTVHIPVILLTARAGHEDKLTGLKTGADDYLPKPFNMQELKIRADNLIRQRRQLRERFQREALLGLDELVSTPVEEEFVTKIQQVIEQNLENPDYSVEDFCRDLGLSRTQLYRKLKAWTNLTPHDFIRLCRLKKAAFLLKESSATVTEIAYTVGFQNISYFGRLFKKQFGSTPGEFSSSHQSQPRKEK